MSPVVPHIIAQNTFLLSADRCIFWEEQQALILSDLHLGKTGHFRKSGIAIPQAVFTEDMQRLITLLQLFKPAQVIIIDNGKIKAADTPANLTREMRAAGRIQVEIHADPAVVAGALNRLDHVKKVTPELMDDGWTRFTVWVDSGSDVREQISQLSSQYGWPLRSLFRHEATLEDVFVELTRKD